jgi:hypothetical protein
VELVGGHRAAEVVALGEVAAHVPERGQDILVFYAA